MAVFLDVIRLYVRLVRMLVLQMHNRRLPRRGDDCDLDTAD